MIQIFLFIAVNEIEDGKKRKQSVGSTQMSQVSSQLNEQMELERIKSVQIPNNEDLVSILPYEMNLNYTLSNYVNFQL